MTLSRFDKQKDFYIDDVIGIRHLDDENVKIRKATVKSAFTAYWDEKIIGYTYENYAVKLIRAGRTRLLNKPS